MESEIEDIKDDPEGDFPDDLLEDIIERRLEDVKYDIEGFMNDWGLEINNYIDRDAFIKAVVDEDGYGTTLNGYDGSYDTVNINGTDYVVMRID